MPNLYKLSLLFAVLFTALVTASFGADGPPPGSVRILDVKALGTGCPQGTGVINISEDAKAMTLVFEKFVVEISSATPRPPNGPNSHGSMLGLVTDRKSCQIEVTLSTPDGWQHSFQEIEVFGYANLDKRTIGRIETLFGFPAHALGPGTLRYRSLGQQFIKGEFAGSFHKTNKVMGHLSDPMAWAACRRPNREVKIAMIVTAAVDGGRDSKAMMALDALDGVVTNQYGLIWKPCPK